MLERDKAMKLELDVANSLNSDMTLRLAMNQRTMKALNEKVAALEAAEVQARQKHEAQLREKAEALIQVEARMNNVSKKARSENSKMVCTAFFWRAPAPLFAQFVSYVLIGRYVDLPGPVFRANANARRGAGRGAQEGWNKGQC
jgi:hypothetical protein